MPWTKKDVASHKAGLSDKQAGAWVKIANETLADCLADDGDQAECEGKAIRIANVAAAEVGEQEVGGAALVAGVEGEEEAEEMDMSEAVWKTAFVNDLPDSSFALILPGGEKNGEGKTKPRSLRKLPYKNAEGAVDVAHLRNALARLPQVKGITKAQRASALKELQVAAKKHLKTHQEEMGEAETLGLMVASAVAAGLLGTLIEVDAGLENFSSQVRSAFRTVFQKRQSYAVDAAPEPYYWIKEVFIEHPDLGDAVVVEKDGALWLVSYTQDDEGIFTFAAPEDWERVRQTYVKVQLETEAEEVAEAELSEKADLSEVSRGRAVNFIEAQAGSPAYIDFIPVGPGWGNKKKNHYYDLPILKEFAGAWKGAKMWASDHRPEEKNALNQISEVVESPVGYTDDGVPIARAVILSAAFEDVVRRRSEAGILHTLENSILAAGTVRKKPYEEGGRKGKYVESIDGDGAVIDWVTKGGARGHALALAESDTEDGGSSMSEEEKDQQEIEESATEPTEIVMLAEASVTQIVKASGLPRAAKERLAGGEYENAQAVTDAVAAEVAYLKEITGSGRVTGQGPSTAPAEQRLSEADLQARLDDVDRRHGLYVKEGV